MPHEKDNLSGWKCQVRRAVYNVLSLYQPLPATVHYLIGKTCCGAMQDRKVSLRKAVLNTDF